MIAPGDLIIGDADGLLCVLCDATETIYAAAKDKQAAEAKMMAAIRDDHVSKPWVDETLNRLGCEGV